MEEKKSLGLKIPADIHQLLKVYAAQNGLSLIKTAEKLICEAIQNLKQKPKNDE